MPDMVKITNSRLQQILNFITCFERWKISCHMSKTFNICLIMLKNGLSAGAPPQTSLGSLLCSPDPELLEAKEEGKRGEGRDL